MIISLQNRFLQVEISTLGAELRSVYKDGRNFIWEIDKKFWDKTSPVLFPIVGGLKNDSYRFDGKTYSLPRHGFARDHEFKILEKTPESVIFSLRYTEETLKIYPFKFELRIAYLLSKNILSVKYTVLNLSPDRMFFSLGAHPAFALKNDITDYALEFDSKKNLISYKLRDSLFSGETEEIKLQGKILPLAYRLFEKDAVVLKESATSSLTLLKNEIRQLKMHFEDFPYLGIWTKKNAPFLCIEPWLGIADNHSASGKIEEKEGIQELSGNSEKSFQWKAEFF